MMELQSTLKKKTCLSAKHITIFLFSSFPILLLIFYTQSSSFYLNSTSWKLLHRLDSSRVVESLNAKLRDSVTFLPLKDLRFTETAMTGNTWFMSSLNDTHEASEPEHLYFPSEASKGRVLCIRGRNIKDGTKNSYALAWRENLPNSAKLLKGLTFVSYSYYTHENLWHGLNAMVPFARWSMKNDCARPKRWVLFHWGELRYRMGKWVHELMQANFGEVKVEKFEEGDDDVVHCFERAVVMRHDIGGMSLENKLKAFDLLRCKARRYCGLGAKENETDLSTVRMTLLMRRGSRSFKNASAVTNVFANECSKIKGCVLKVAQSEDLTFCDQVRVMSKTDIVASPHGAQLTNMMFMERGSSVMEFFPKGWLEYAGIGQYAHHWLAGMSGMKHQGAWWDSNGPPCPHPQQQSQCFDFHKNGRVDHNLTYFAEWARRVINQVKLTKMTYNGSKTDQTDGSNGCVC